MYTKNILLMVGTRLVLIEIPIYKSKIIIGNKIKKYKCVFNYNLLNNIK